MPTVLVVDDAKVIRLLLEDILKDLGFDVRQACNGSEALDALRQSPEISLALVDWNMPKMNGLDLVTAMRADLRYSSITILMVTREADVDHITAALAAGADDYIMKPFTGQVIAEKLLLLGLIQGQSV